MRKTLYSGLAVLVFVCLVSPVWAQKGTQGGQAGTAAGAASHGKGQAQHIATHKKHASMAATRSNKGGAVRGRARAQEVQSLNTKADTERGFTTAPGLAGTQGQQTGKPAAGTGKGPAQSQKGKKPQGGGSDPDESRD